MRLIPLECNHLSQDYYHQVFDWNIIERQKKIIMIKLISYSFSNFLHAFDTSIIIIPCTVSSVLLFTGIRSSATQVYHEYNVDHYRYC